jgi:hypothetical protein
MSTLGQPKDFRMLSDRFGQKYDRFLLLNDVAVEACRAVNFPMGCIRAAALSLAGECRLAGVPAPSTSILLNQQHFPAKEAPTCLR